MIDIRFVLNNQATCLLKWHSLYCQMIQQLSLSTYQQPEPAVEKVLGIYMSACLTYVILKQIKQTHSYVHFFTAKYCNISVKLYIPKFSSVEIYGC